MTLPLAQHLSILRHAIVTIAIHGLPQEAADLHVARVRVDASAERSTTGPECSHDHVMEHFAIANLRGNRARLADLVKDIERSTLDLRNVSDVCGHGCAYPRRWVLFRSSRGRFGPASAPIYPAVA